MAEGFGRRIRGLRKAERWTQEDLAARAGVDQATISQIEVGRVQPTMATVTRLANAFGHDVADLARLAGHLPPLPDDAPPGLYPDDLEAKDIQALFANPEIAAVLRRVRIQEGDQAYRETLEIIAESVGLTLRAIERGRASK